MEEKWKDLVISKDTFGRCKSNEKSMEYDGITEIERRGSMSFDEFFREFMFQNIPVIVTGLTNNWNASKDWVIRSSGTQNCAQTPNLDFLLQHFGESSVQVAKCDTQEYTDQKRIKMTLEEYIKYWKSLPSTDNAASNLLYLKVR
jgi:hypothetical protein